MINRLIRFGCPWHGPIQDGQLTLPNDESMPYRQPAGNDDGDRAGDTLLQRMPWAQSISPSPEDVEAGRQWTDYALLCGGRKQLHGQELSGWIYAAPDGTPWWIDVSSLYSRSITSGFAATWRARPFGRIGKGATWRSFEVLLPDTGQSTPSLTGTLSAYLHDITPDGSKAIFEILLRPSSSPGGSINRVFPVGYWLLTLSGQPGEDLVADLSVLVTRAEALGSVSDDNQVRSELLTWVRYGTMQSQQGGSLVYEWWGPDPQSGGTTLGTRTVTLSSRVVGMWFNSAGTPVPVHYSVTSTWSRDAEYTETYEGGPYVQTGSAWSGAPLVATSRLVSTGSESHSVTLSWDGHSISESMSASYSRELEGTHIPYGPGATGGWEYAEQGSRDAANAFGVMSEPTPTDLFGPEPPPTNQQRATFLNSPRMTAIHGASFHIDLLRYSNNLMCLVTRRQVVSGPHDWMAGPCLTPGGVSGSYTQTEAGRRFGSFNPATNQIVRGTEAPICWT